MSFKGQLKAHLLKKPYCITQTSIWQLCGQRSRVRMASRTYVPIGSSPLPAELQLLTSMCLSSRKQQASSGWCRPRQRADPSCGQHYPGWQQKLRWSENYLISLGKNTVSIDTKPLFMQRPQRFDFLLRADLLLLAYPRWVTEKEIFAVSNLNSRKMIWNNFWKKKWILTIS